MTRRKAARKSSAPTSRTASGARCKNARSLDEIADRINALEKANVIDVGELLVEARAQCEHGGWYAWLDSEFEWSEDTAERLMKVAKLASKYRNLRDLKLGKMTLYALADHEPEEDLPAIINELARYATKTRLVTRDARRVIKVGIGRRRYGDHPDATLAALTGLDESSGESWYEKAVAALRERQPTTDESARLIIGNVFEREMEDESNEIEAILDGPPPKLPPPASAEPQKVSTETDWAEGHQFADAVERLDELRAKPIARVTGKVFPATLRGVIDYLIDVEAAGSPEVTP
jgi:hypothetical protein